MLIPSGQDLKYFLAICDTLNFSRAAERLGVRQSTLSQAIGRLEESVAIPLFHRSKSGVTLTRAGDLLRQEAATLLKDWEEIANRAKSAETKPSGVYTLGAHPSVAGYALGKPVHALLERFEALELKLVHGLSREILEQVVSGEVDYGLVINPIRHPDLVIQPVLKDRVGIWALKGKASLEEILIYDPELNQSRELVNKVRFKRHIHSKDLSVILRLALEGCGAAILPERVVNAAQPKGERTLAPIADHFFQDELCLIYRADLQKNAGSAEIRKTILSELKKLT